MLAGLRFCWMLPARMNLVCEGAKVTIVLVLGLQTLGFPEDGRMGFACLQRIQFECGQTASRLLRRRFDVYRHSPEEKCFLSTCSVLLKSTFISSELKLVFCIFRFILKTCGCRLGRTPSMMRLPFFFTAKYHQHEHELEAVRIACIIHTYIHKYIST